MCVRNPPSKISHTSLSCYSQTSPPPHGGLHERCLQVIFQVLSNPQLLQQLGVVGQPPTKVLVLGHLLFPTDRSIVRERRPSFEGSFVECALLLVGQIAGVWTTLEGGASEIDSDPPASPPMADKGCVLDMLLAPAGFRAWRERVPARDSFRFDGRKKDWRTPRCCQCFHDPMKLPGLGGSRAYGHAILDRRSTQDTLVTGCVRVHTQRKTC